MWYDFTISVVCMFLDNVDKFALSHVDRYLNGKVKDKIYYMRRINDYLLHTDKKISLNFKFITYTFNGFE